MSKKGRFSNLEDATVKKQSFSTGRRVFKGVRKIMRSLERSDFHWVNSSNLSQRLNKIKKNYICWIGHATYLLNINGTNMLIDPFFSDFAGPISWMSPKRLVPPALLPDELPKIDYILITHNHYDHLDKPFLKSLPNKNNIKVITPSNLGSTLKKMGFRNITELGWHESLITNAIKITALPAYHYSRRGFFDHNKSWWCSYSIEFADIKLFHSGDTAYGKGFARIGEYYGPFDYAMIGIGAYHPQEVMKAVHVNPEEAYQIARDIKTKTILPMHWGTIVLSLEPITEPIERLMQINDFDTCPNKPIITMSRIGDIAPLRRSISETLHDSIKHYAMPNNT